MSLTTNLQAFYKLSDLTDSSGNGKTLTNNGNVTFASGKIGNAALFNGTNRLYTESFSTIDTSQPFCVSFWSKPTANTVGTVCANGTGVGFNIHNDSSGSLNFNNGQSGDCAVGNAFIEGVWRHYVCMVSNGNTVVYINGSEVYNQQSNVSYSTTINSISLGSYDGNQLMFNGQIDAVGIWNRALTEAEVTELYNSGTGLELEGAGSVNLTTSLQAFYKLSDLTDASGNGNTLTNVGGINFGSGKIGNCAIFDANGAGGKHLATPVSGGPGSGLTVSLWAKANSTSVAGSLIQSVTSDQNGWFMGIDAGSQRLAYLAGSGGWSVAELFGSPLNDNTWYHIVKRADASGVKIYIDGAEAGSWANNTWTSAPIELGHFAYHNGSRDESWNGQIDAVGIWNRALTEAEVAALYNSGAGLELGSEGNNYNSYFSIAKIQGKTVFAGNVKFMDPMGYNS